ncbi:centriole, cilia and spindle-associated protein [Microcaecilia unicolor]|uniref:Centriole, cilia and spindle-associated protein n=1 Tax=Microcaecilia unicolor TaxID=1415580 RepID=A0A6P7XPR1_9AMPH|nr:centriole, cilia and spindle-associated protein [Microcaecilia unicolor]
MHCKTFRSEYMKRFKDPHWDAHWQRYQELLCYRRSRRLWEQTHCPWVWEGWEEQSDSSSTNSMPCSYGSEGLPEPNHLSSGPQADTEQQYNKAAIIENPREPDLPGIPQPLENVVKRYDEEKAEEQAKVKEKTRNAFPSAIGRKSIKNVQKKGLSKEIRYPFALYACGEKMRDTASQKTHNVCAPASACEIHESALRAKNRRQKEKRKQMQKQRARSADMEQSQTRKPSPADNPWLTEYMRCYSARDH